MAVYERSEVNFLIPQGTLPWQPILWARIPYICAINRSAPSARSRRRSVSATAARCWAQANKLPDSMDAGEPINNN